MNLTKSFTLEEFLRSETAARLGRNIVPTEREVANIQALCDNVLQPLRDAIERVITITSGLRPAWLNMAIGGSMRSQHMDGEAADIIAQNYRPRELCHTIVTLDLPFDQLILEFDKWTHVSYGPRNRKQVLTARYVDGKVRYMEGIV